MLNELLKQPFSGFTNESLKFLKSLSDPKNNNKQWFDVHRDEYESFLKLPMRNLIDDLSIQIKKIDTDIVVNYKSIFRINRDIRFSKDKIPYKNQYSAAFAFNTVKSAEIPQFYFHFSKDEFLFAAGQYSTDNVYAGKIRKAIVDDYKKFKGIIDDKVFKKEFGSVEGIKLSRLPKGFENYNEMKYDKLLFEFLKMKQFYVYKTYKPSVVLSEEITEIIISGIKKSYKFTKFLHNAVK